LSGDHTTIGTALYRGRSRSSLFTGKVAPSEGVDTYFSKKPMEGYFTKFDGATFSKILFRGLLFFKKLLGGYFSNFFAVTRR